jgi:hypothetical protein
MDARRLGSACALVAVPVLVVAGPLAAVFAAHPAMDRPTKTIAEQTVSIHLDAPPPGVDVRVRPSTTSLLEAAGISRLRPAVTPVSTPPGTPTTLGLAQHVSPSCSGTGSDGDRVQVAYVTQTGGTDRYAAMLPALESYVADVDDVMAVSSAETGGGRRVRWVTNASCVPVVLHVVLPAGSLGSASDGDGGFNATISAMKVAGYGAVGRKYLMFVEANNLCGIAQVYPDSTKSNNNNDGRFPMYARVDSACWTSSFHSVAAHELMHTLGSVQSDSPHPSAAGHCVDESDVMCYADGPGVVLEYVCPPSHEQLYDCNHDDYFSTNTPVGNYLATHWNTADSPFLDTVPALGPPLALAVNAPTHGAFGATWSFTVGGTAPPGASYVWAVNPTNCTVVGTGSTGSTAKAQCQGWASTSVTVTVYRTAAGVTMWGAATVPLSAGTSGGGSGIRHNPLPPHH